MLFDQQCLPSSSWEKQALRCGSQSRGCSLFSTGNVCQVYTSLCHSTDLAFCKPQRKLASPVGAVLTWPQSRSALLVGMTTIFTCSGLTLTSALTPSCLFHLPLLTTMVVFLAFCHIPHFPISILLYSALHSPLEFPFLDMALGGSLE